MDQFDAPSTGAKLTDFDGQLLLIQPETEQKAIPTAFGPADAIEANVIVLDGQNTGENPGVLIFQKALQGQLRTKVGTGRYVLGRLGRGQAKAGQSAPWILTDPTEADKNLARTYLNNRALVTTPARDNPPF
jgi:hypothetical protein